MGKFRKGILGGFSGTVGTVVGGSWKGIDVMRSRPTPGKSGVTLAQEIHRAKFAMVTKFISTMKELLAVSYREYAGKMTGYNSALSYQMKNAIHGEYPNLSLDYSQVLLAKGNLTGPLNGVASPASQEVIAFSWTDNSGTGSAKPTDKAVVVAYCDELKQVQYTTNGPARSSRGYEFPVAGFRGKQVHTWLAFIADTGKEVSLSTYTGLISVP